MSERPAEYIPPGFEDVPVDDSWRPDIAAALAESLAAEAGGCQHEYMSDDELEARLASIGSRPAASS
ncbi:hypothetical protein I6A84_34715 [Frankia sp. CNm7]|uniref:Uncharacterized protein n=1 Tax=Frankia nepalensis TaxID=1836974 RepID=A0A937RP50_9ACTN|nr:hypothetical protein [Frankia nepalensis]MBL7495121.1 hypothetical protein [Frankia nepalensis]MBL7515433.1 hypothetical protein [Frankia nepalensis]MBL7523101.1 hypothetical protein [Frankia nepalensis]MBL7632359.1 hypothetical protein [Frankia nepalensis]